jgi:hypothetical protein
MQIKKGRKYEHFKSKKKYRTGTGRPALSIGTGRYNNVDIHSSSNMGMEII